jgi:hypothetical protein
MSASSRRSQDNHTIMIDSKEAVTWAALMAGRPELKGNDIDFVREQLNAWWKNAAEAFSAGFSDLPEAFRTTRIWSEIKFVEAHFLALEPILNSLRAETFSFTEALDHVARHFGGDKGRLLKWIQNLENLRGLILWLPTFVNAQDYLNSAFLLGEEKPDQLCTTLRSSLGRTHRFFDSNVRTSFNSDFLEFKKIYSDRYSSLHDAAFGVLGGSARELKVDSISLRNLDLLSSLQYSEKAYVNRVKVMARWAQRNGCRLPVRHILERHPRCYCNFNPSGRQQPTDSAAQINALIKEGIDHFRKGLRSFEQLILKELEAESVNENISKQITDLLGNGPLPQLKPQSIKVLNRMILKHSNEFLLGLRS